MLILAAVLGVFVYGMIAAMLGTILPELSKRFALSPKQNGNLALTQAIGLMIGSFGVGPLMDIQGKKVGMLLSLALVALALLLLRRASGYSSAMAAMLLLGLGGGVLVTAANSLPGDIDPINPASLNNRMNIFFGLGGLVTPLVSARLFKNEVPKLTLFAATMAALALAVSAITEFKGPSGAVSFQFSMVTDLLGSGRLIMLSLFLFLYVACEVGVWNWLARHLIAQGLPESKALTILSLGFALGLLVGRLAAAEVLKTATPESVLIGSAALMAVTTFVMLQSANPNAAWVAVFVAGLAMAPVFPTTLGIVGQKFPNSASTAIGIAVTMGWLGLVVSSPLIGAIAGDDPKRLKKALLLLPAFSVAMLAVGFAL
jgi:fucose permease